MTQIHEVKKKVIDLVYKSARVIRYSITWVIRNVFFSWNLPPANIDL